MRGAMPYVRVAERGGLSVIGHDVLHNPLIVRVY